MAQKRKGTARLLIGIIAIVLLNAWFAFAAVRSLLRSEMWRAHTWQVVGQIESMLNSATDAENAARGYLIMGDERALQPYTLARADVMRQMDEVASLTADNLHQKPNMDAVSDVMEQRFAMLQGSIDARRSHGYDAARALIVSGNGLGEITRLREVADRMEAEERRLLTIREEDAHRNGLLAYFAIGFASALDLLLLVFAFRLLARERELRFASEQASARIALANEQIEQKSSEIQALNLELEERVRRRTAELESTNRELEAFSYSVSHDLRAPLRTIDGFSLALEEDYTDVVDATGRDYISRVRVGVQRMGGLIDALLQLSRITRTEISRQDVNMSELAGSVAQNLREENPGQTIEFSIEPEMQANADPHLLRVALENLMGNAVKFSSKEPISRISIGRDTEKQAFVIQDNGAGFDMHYASKLFNAFNRLHGDKDFKGSGIGLATVARVIRSHHGAIWAESRVGHGACFWFTLG